jgi:hypothetical protein
LSQLKEITKEEIQISTGIGAATNEKPSVQNTSRPNTESSIISLHQNENTVVLSKFRMALSSDPLEPRPEDQDSLKDREITFSHAK